MSEEFYSNGKLIISGEYLVLDGALSLALPTKLGQSLKVEKLQKPILKWKSFDHNGDCWFNTEFPKDQLENDEFTYNNEVELRLNTILREAKKLNPKFLTDESGYSIETFLSFPRDWGLGTSSTLINNISSWAKINPYALLKSTLGGSGYDIACAQNTRPLTYKLESGRPVVTVVDFDPPFKNDLYFVYLNVKQNSSKEVKSYQRLNMTFSNEIDTINKLTASMLKSKSTEEFSSIIETHENIVSKVIGQIPVQQRLFSDFKGNIKSLGAWGGDFILVVSKNNPRSYFNSKGYNTMISYEDLILNSF